MLLGVAGEHRGLDCDQEVRRFEPNGRPRLRRGTSGDDHEPVGVAARGSGFLKLQQRQASRDDRVYELANGDAASAHSRPQARRVPPVRGVDPAGLQIARVHDPARAYLGLDEMAPETRMHAEVDESPARPEYPMRLAE